MRASQSMNQNKLLSQNCITRIIDFILEGKKIYITIGDWLHWRLFFHLSFFLLNLFDLQDFCRWPDEPFEEMDSTLAVQQYIQQLIKKDPSNIEAILTMPESQDEGVWKYEHLRYSKQQYRKILPWIQIVKIKTKKIIFF